MHELQEINKILNISNSNTNINENQFSEEMNSPTKFENQ